MSQEPQFRVRYWGVTGTLARTLLPSEITDKLAAAIRRLLDEQVLEEIVRSRADLPTIRKYLESSLPVHLRSSYLGNSTCIEIATPGELIVVDCGTGFRDLGYDLERRWNAPGFTGSRHADIVFTHPHIDHIAAIPFVGSFYDPRNHFTIWGTQAMLDSLDAIFLDRSPLARVYVPTGYNEMSGIKQLRAVQPGDDFFIGETRLGTFSLNHPGGCLAYRLERGGHRVVIATDHEHQEIPDRRLADFARGADLLYTDAQYLDGGVFRPGCHRRRRCAIACRLGAFNRRCRGGDGRRSGRATVAPGPSRTTSKRFGTAPHRMPRRAIASRATSRRRQAGRRLSRATGARRFDVVDLRAPHKTAGDCPLFAESAEQNGDYRLLSSGFVRGS